MQLPRAFLVALSVQLVCQLFKLVYYSARDRRLNFGYFVTAGGIPSAHAAFVAALSVSIGMSAGFASDVFSVSGVFSLIVIYDAYRLRGHVQHHAKLINTHVLKPAGEKPVTEMVGHSITELLVGLAIGAAWALLAAVVLG